MTAGACGLLRQRLAGGPLGDAGTPPPPSLAQGSSQDCDGADLRACTGWPCADRWLSACVTWVSPECRAAASTATQEGLLEALRALANDSDAFVRSASVQVTCSIRPRGGESLYFGDAGPRCVAARLESGDGPVSDYDLAVLPYVQRPETRERFASALRDADARHLPGRDALYRWLCLDHAPATADLRDACAERGPDDERTFREGTARAAREADRLAEREERNYAVAVYASLGFLPLYAVAMWRLRGRISGGFLGYAGLVVASILGSGLDLTSFVPPGPGPSRSGVIALLAALVLGLLAFHRAVRVPVTLIVVVASARGLIAMGSSARDTAAMAAQHESQDIAQPVEAPSLAPAW
jgi:hypothetical protein